MLGLAIIAQPFNLLTHALLVPLGNDDHSAPSPILASYFLMTLVWCYQVLNYLQRLSLVSLAGWQSDKGVAWPPQDVDSMQTVKDLIRAAVMAAITLAVGVCLARRSLSPWVALRILAAAAPTVTAMCMTCSWLLLGEGYTPDGLPPSCIGLRMLSCYVVSLATTQHARRLITSAIPWRKQRSSPPGLESIRELAVGGGEEEEEP